MRKPRRKISQREARELRKRVAYLERITDINIYTPTPRWCVCNFTMSDAMLREIGAAKRFGATVRAELNGNRIDIYCYRNAQGGANNA